MDQSEGTAELQKNVDLKQIAGDLDDIVVQSVAVVHEETGELKKIHLADSATQRTSSRPSGQTAQSPCPKSSQTFAPQRVSQLPWALEK